jgi:phosphohistidine phosphatase
MKTLLLMRHAKSDRDDPSLPDHERPLNKRGRRDSPRMGRLLHDEHLLPDLLITSDAVRARETAQAVAEAGGYERNIAASDRLYQADPDVYIEVLQRVPDSQERVMVIGHNPVLQEVVEQLTAETADLPTAAIAQIELPIERWQDLERATRGRLVRVWRPRELG